MSNAPPSSGILMGTTSDFEGTGSGDERGGGHERKWVDGGVMWGSYQYAPLWKTSRERERITGDYANDANQGYAFVLSRNNRAVVDGNVVSETSPAKGTLEAASNSKTWVTQASFLSILNTGDGVVYIEGRESDSVFRDVEAFGKDDPAIFRLDCSQEDITNLRYDNVRIRVDDLENQLGASRGWLVDDEGNGNIVDRMSINNLTTSLTDQGSEQPIIEVQNTAQIRNFEIAGENSSMARSLPAVSAQPWNAIDVRDIDFDSPTFIGKAVLENVTATDATVRNALSINNPGQRRSVVFEGVSSHGLSGQESSNLVINNVVAEATGSGNDAVHLADQNFGNKSWLHGIRVTGSDRNGLWLDRFRESIVSGCITDGFGDGITEDDLFLRNGLRVVIANNYFNGDVTIGSGSTETILMGNYIRGTFTDDGTRTVVNGRGTNNGDPKSTGEWNGSESFARSVGVTVEDTTNSNVYWPKEDGTWSQIGS